MRGLEIATVPHRQAPPALLLRASCRAGGPGRTRTLAPLTARAPARMEALRRALTGAVDGLSGDLPPTWGPIVAVWCGWKPLAERIGLTRVLGTARLATLARLLVLGRVAAQGLRLSAVRGSDQHAVAEPLGRGRFDDDDRSTAVEPLAPRQAPSEDTRSRV